MMNFVGKKVLITGGAGFIGSAIARRLVTARADVTVVDSLIPEYGGNLRNLHDIIDRIDLNVSDVRDPHSMEHLVNGVDIVFNLAGQTSHLDSMQDPFTDLEINSRAQLSILESLRRNNPRARIVFASTRQIYGKPDYLPVNEQHPLRPVDINGVNKLSGEWFHLLYNKVYGIPACALRLTNTFGPGMRIKDSRQTFIGVWLRNLLEGRPIDVWGGEQLRDLNFIDDVVDAFLLVAGEPLADGRVFNLGAADVVSLKQLAALAIELNGHGQVNQMEFPAERKSIDIGDYYSDFSSIREALGWSPRVQLREGLSRTLEFYRMNLEYYL